jgi:hypothetical protein
MNSDLIMQQSKAAFKQWAIQWREHAVKHSTFKQHSFEEFENVGVGRAVLCVANGYSFEEEIETIKEHQANVDIMACDKTLGHLLDNGVTPQYVMVCDANVDYDRYMAKWKDQLKDTILFINVCANPKWSHNGNWKKVVFFSNKDVLDSHLEFAALSSDQLLDFEAEVVSMAEFEAVIVFASKLNYDNRKLAVRAHVVQGRLRSSHAPIV